MVAYSLSVLFVEPGEVSRDDRAVAKISPADLTVPLRENLFGIENEFRRALITDDLFTACTD
jgi:hypothetical protein